MDVQEALNTIAQALFQAALGHESRPRCELRVTWSEIPYDSGTAWHPSIAIEAVHETVVPLTDFSPVTLG